MRTWKVQVLPAFQKLSAVSPAGDLGGGALPNCHAADRMGLGSLCGGYWSLAPYSLAADLSHGLCAGWLLGPQELGPGAPVRGPYSLSNPQPTRCFHTCMETWTLVNLKNGLRWGFWRW